MRRALGIATAVLGVAACGGGRDETLRLASDGVFSCGASTVRVEFDPTSGVAVKTPDGALAAATFTQRQVNEDCSSVPGAPRTTMESSPYDDDLLAKPIYGRAELECTVAGGVRIDLHPIFNANIGRNDGSVLLIADGVKLVVSSVLKNKGDPRASRVYHAPRYCRAT
jgi:hypothetical protein